MDNYKILTQDAFEKLYNKLSTQETFKQKMEKILKDRHYNATSFCNATELNRNIYSNIKKEEYKPSLRIVVSICVGLKLNVFDAEYLLQLAGYVLVRTKKLDFAYSILLENSREWDITECNNKLKEWGFKENDFLGSQAYQ